MKTILNVKLVTLAVFVMLLSTAARAGLIEVAPINYMVDQPTSKGSYTYHDETGNQLTDGQYGSNNWKDNLGNGNAYEWLGWYESSSVNIDFSLDADTVLNQISVGSTQDRLNDVVLPSLYIYSRDSLSDEWSLLGQELIAESSANNKTYYTYNFTDLNITDQFIRVEAQHSLDGPWTFIDEVDFYQAAVDVAEPPVLIIFAMSIIGFLVLRTRKQ